MSGIKKENRMILSQFINKCNELHNNRYDYSNIIDFSLNKQVPVICKIHGLFYQKARNHLTGSNCKKCNNDNYRFNNIIFKNIIKEIESINIPNITSLQVIPKSLSDFVSTQVEFICNTHGHIKTSLYLIRKYKICPKCHFDQQYPNYIDSLSDKKLYYNLVKHHTYFHWIHHQKFINHYNVNRSLTNYHIDHLYSINQGYNDFILPSIIGHWCNLWITSALDNKRKGKNCGITKDVLFATFKWATTSFYQKLPIIEFDKNRNKIRTYIDR